MKKINKPTLDVYYNTHKIVEKSTQKQNLPERPIFNQSSESTDKEIDKKEANHNLIPQSQPSNVQISDDEDVFEILSEYFVVSNYLYFNNGFIRFVPTDIIRILPHFFNESILNSNLSQLQQFKPYQQTLWSLQDEILAIWNREYLKNDEYENTRLQSETYFQNLRVEIGRRLRDEVKYKHDPIRQDTVNLVDAMITRIEDDIKCEYPWGTLGYDLSNDIIITNKEHYVPTLDYKTNECKSESFQFLEKHNLSVKHSKMIPILHDVRMYCDAINLWNKSDFNGEFLNEYLVFEDQDHRKEFQYEWLQYNIMLPSMKKSPVVLIDDDITDYHFYICAVSHVIRNLDSFAPFQISTTIISNKL
eukprot:20907_1